MPIATLSTKYRPVRIGFLVRAGVTADVVRAAELSSLLSGGGYNAIIPVPTSPEEEELAKGLIHVLRPDVLHPIADSPEVQAFARRWPFLRDPLHYADDLFYEDWRTKKRKVAYLDILGPALNQWFRAYRTVPDDFRSNVALFSWKDEDPLATLFTMQYGKFPDDLDLKDDFRATFRGALRASDVVLAPEEPVPGAAATLVGPIAFGRSILRATGGSWVDAPGLFVGRASNPDDLVSFWNLRAAGRDLAFLGLDAIERLRDSVGSFLNWCDSIPSPGNPDFARIPVCYSCSDEELEDALSSFPTRKPKSRFRSGPGLWNGLNVQSVELCFDWQTSTATIEPAYGKYMVTVALPEKRFIREVVDERPEVTEQLIAVSFELFSELYYDDYTLRVPDIPELTEFYSRAICTDPWRLRVSRRGFALLVRLSDENERLYPVSKQDVLTQVLRHAGIESKPSQPGILCSAIISSMGDRDPLEACRVFKIRGVRRLIKSLANGKALTLRDTVKAITEDGGFKGFDTLYIEGRDEKRLTPHAVISFLIRKRVLRPVVTSGAKLDPVATRCEICGLKNTIALERFADRSWACEYCESSQNLRPRTLSVFRQQPEVWRYQRDGMFTKDNHQEGAIPVMLALLTFRRILEQREIAHSTARLLDGAVTCEGDLFVLTEDRYTGRPQVVIGELKDDSGRIDKKDVHHFLDLRRQLGAKGIDCFPLFGKTASAFTAEELDVFRSVDRSVPMILLTAVEMEPYEPYWHDHPDVAGVPRKYASTLEDMAINSRARYLT